MSRVPFLGWVDGDNMALLTDLYELTMADSYYRRGKNQETTFDLFARHLPPHRSYLVAAGLEQVLYYLAHLQFTSQAIDYLASLKMFSRGFLHYLKGFRFTGTVWAIPEGEIFFPKEPVMRVTAPRIEAQIVETFLLNTINFQSMIASKTSRVVQAAQGRAVVDFSPRRDHGADAALKVARASFIGGCVGTSCTLAGQVFDIPVYGTMAHSYVMSFETELEAFRAFAQDFPSNALLLIDTYDTLQGARHAVIVAREMETKGHRLRGVRLDSGDLVGLSREVRSILDEEGLDYVKILLSGDLNEYKIQAILDAGGVVDFLGVGTELGTSRDAPSLGGVYKLVKDNMGPRIKLSEGKVTLPGEKQVYRVLDKRGLWKKDIIALKGEEIKPPGESYPLLVKVMGNGEVVCDLPSLKEIRSRCLETVDRLPPEYRELEAFPEDGIPVELSPQLDVLTQRLIQEYRELELKT
jgi:nicotinate phosphoribosyltransferase